MVASRAIANSLLLPVILLAGLLPACLPFSVRGKRAGLVASRRPLTMVRPIPVEISSTDTPPPIVPADILLPNAEVHSLDGGGFLGAMLWTFVLYNGLFGLAGRPADWTLPLLAKISKQESAEWYLNYKSGYDYFVPPTLEALRVSFFGVLGYLLNDSIVSSFDGDIFWGWSIGTCLAIPSALINVSRDKRISREKSEFQVSLVVVVFSVK